MLSTASYHTANFYREATPDEIGQRLDRSLSKLPLHPPKHLIQRLIRTGSIRVNCKKTSPSYRLQEKDNIEFPKNFLEKEGASLPSKHLNKKLKKMGESILKTIIYEDESLLICNKPCAIAVHGGTNQILGLISALRTVYPDVHHLNLVHRLDKPTSGILLFTKDLKSLRHLHQQFAQSTIKKTYLAILHGKNTIASKKWTIENNLISKKDKIQPKVLKTGKLAQTDFLTLEKFKEDLALTQVIPKQGRTHQIRIHAAQHGTPILGDDKYILLSQKNKTEPQEQGLIKKCLKQIPKESIYLHAYEISFVHPKTEKNMTISASMPAHWENCLKTLRHEIAKKT